VTGRLYIVGLGPGPAEWIVPEASAALAVASDIVGYQGYLDRVPQRPGQLRHGSDNRVEISRARDALGMAAEGRQVAVVSGGDPGVFAMAAAVFEAIEAGDAAWRGLDVTVVPGISAMQAAAARLGAPLGHDFCAISLSDNLKPWDVVERRLRCSIRRRGFGLTRFIWRSRCCLAARGQRLRLLSLARSGGRMSGSC
jgi:precorrin-3B C17-methyltransferase